MRRYIIDIDFSQPDIVRYIETFTQNFYPCFFSHETAVGRHLGYGSKEQEYSEFLDIVIDQKDRSVTVERDLKATLILRYYFDGSRLIISSDWTYFAQQLDLRHMLNVQYLKMVLGDGKDAKWSIVEHMFQLYPRKKYSFRQDSLESEEISYTAKPIEIEDMLRQNFCHLNEHNTVGAELSWGKDSAFLPILARKSKFSPFKFTSWQLHSGEVWEQQRSTLSKVVDFLGIPYEFHRITAEDYPLQHDPVGAIYHPIEEIYKNSVLGEIALFKKHGINTIFNGFWGDEAFEDRKEPSNWFCDGETDELSFIFQPQFIEEVQQLNNSEQVYQDGLFSTSLYDSLVSRNNLYIQHGIRPMTPYLNIDAYAFFQSLHVTKKQFFTSFYDNFDPVLKGAFGKNTNMSAYFVSFFKSSFFNNLLQACLDQPSIIRSRYNIENIKKHFGDTRDCSEQLADRYDFFLYKFVKMSLMLK